MPYGSRSKETVIKYVRQDIRFISSFPIKAVLIACGTASALALPALKNELVLPTVGVISSTAEMALAASKTKRIGIIGTSGTISSGSYEQELKHLCPEVETIAVSCPLFVPLVENGRFSLDDPVPNLVASDYLKPIQEFGVDTLILGCTHYPLLNGVIQSIMGSNVTLINAGAAGGHALKRLLEEKGLCNPQEEPGQISYYVSDRVADFSQLATTFLGEDVTPKQVTKIDIETY